MTTSARSTRAPRAAERKSETTALAPEIRALLDHIAEELAAEYLKLMGVDDPAGASGRPVERREGSK
jgi:hypothetical protein